MKVLIACEFSGIVRDAFTAKGHDAWSCDLLPTESPGPHYQGDVRDILNDRWDMIIAFPDCTFLCSSGLHWNKRRPGRQKKTEEALVFVSTILSNPCEKIALENPIGCISTRIRKYNQKVQPWQFGEDASKGTCLWLKGLPVLKHTKTIPPKGYREVVYAHDLPMCCCCGEPFCGKHDKHYFECDCIGPTQDEATYITIDGYSFATLLNPAPHPVWKNQTPSGQNKLGPSPNRAKLRSLTYQGIAEAMAEQWGNEKEDYSQLKLF